jgi:hypothetical protein
MHVQIDHRHQQVVFAAEGVVRLADWQTAVRQQAEAGAWRYPLLLDLRAQTNLFHPNDLRAMSLMVDGLIREHGPRGPVAFLADTEQKLAVGRLYTMLADWVPFRIKTFQSSKEAIDWLTAPVADP